MIKSQERASCHDKFLLSRAVHSRSLRPYCRGTRHYLSTTMIANARFLTDSCYWLFLCNRWSTLTRVSKMVFASKYVSSSSCNKLAACDGLMPRIPSSSSLGRPARYLIQLLFQIWQAWMVFGTSVFCNKVSKTVITNRVLGLAVVWKVQHCIPLRVLSRYHAETESISSLTLCLPSCVMSVNLHHLSYTGYNKQRAIQYSWLPYLKALCLPTLQHYGIHSELIVCILNFIIYHSTDWMHWETSLHEILDCTWGSKVAQR